MRRRRLDSTDRVNGFRFAPLAAPLALAVAGGATATLRADSSQESATLFLTVLSCAVLAPLAATARRSSRVVPVAALAAFLALAFLPRISPLPAAAVSAVLVLALGAELAERVRGRGGPRLGAALAGLLYATQTLAFGDRLFEAPTTAATLLLLVVAPLGVAWALARVARLDLRGALALGLAGAASGPGWGPVELAALAGATALLTIEGVAAGPRARALVIVAAAALPFAVRGSFGALLALAVAAATAACFVPRPALASVARAALAGAALAALAAGALPWRRPAALESVLLAVATRPLAIVDRPVRADAVVLSASAPVFEAPLPSGNVRSVAVVSYLTNAAALPCAAPIANLTLFEADREVARTRLEVGRDSAEWAARRSDVAAALACPVPAPHWSWIPVEGRFFGTSYQARFRWERALTADRLRLERDPELPEAVEVALFFVGVER